MALRSLTETVYDRPYPSGLNHLSWEIKVNEKEEKCYNQSIISINLSAEPAF